MKRAFFEGRTPAKIIVSYEIVWLLCPMCRNCYRFYFQTSGREERGCACVSHGGSRVQRRGGSLGGHLHQLRFGGVTSDQVPPDPLEWPPCSGCGLGGVCLYRGLGLVIES